MDSGIYKDIAERTGGDIYIGVVGPVRTGKSTFIKRFMETLVLPRIEAQPRRERAQDELPQSSAGRTIMTTEPKFIPEEAVGITLEGGGACRVRLIDCVGYIVPSSLGYIENEAPRMVMTPWFETEIPFNMAAEIGTKKVITEHSTIGLMVTTDGSIGDIPREEYREAEQRVIEELKQINKPFVAIVNSTDPASKQALDVRDEIAEKYGVVSVAVNCLTMGEEELLGIMRQVLYEFPMRQIAVDISGWLMALPDDNPRKSELLAAIRASAAEITKVRDFSALPALLEGKAGIAAAKAEKCDYGSGSGRLEISLVPGLFYTVLSEMTGQNIPGEAELFSFITQAAAIKSEYDKYADALAEVNATGYGIVMPDIGELTLEQPEVISQNGRYGVRLRATAPSIHMIRAEINTEIRPIVGSERQSEELVTYLLGDYENEPEKIWQSNIFGKSLHELVNEGLHAKLAHMPPQARMKLQDTIKRVINEGCNGLFCIIV